MAWDVSVPLAYQNYITTLTLGNTTVAKQLIPPTPGKVMQAVTGEGPLPNEGAARQRVFQGGSRVIDLTAATTDSVANSALLHEAVLMSQFEGVTASGMQPAITGFTTGSITGQNAVNRTGGSFFTEGWTIGDAAFGWGDSVAGNNGILLQVTGVAAGALTFTGTPLTNNATLAAGFQLYKIGRTTRFPIPANSGNTDAIKNVPLIGPLAPQNLSLDQTGISLGANGAIFLSLAANASALPARFDFNAKAALY
jgi:hypothetical protein